MHISNCMHVVQQLNNTFIIIVIIFNLKYSNYNYQ